jgi:nitroreductase
MNTPLITALNWRYATKKFDTAKKIPDADFNELLEVLRLAPSSYGLQPWKFVVVKDPALRAKLVAASWNQPQITNASHLIVLAARTDVDATYAKNYVKTVAEARKLPPEAAKRAEDMIVGDVNSRSKDDILSWNKNQCYIALGMLLEAAALKSIDACPMEGFDPAQYDELLQLGKDNATATVVCALGYRAADDQAAALAKVRFPTREVVVEK